MSEGRPKVEEDLSVVIPTLGRPILGKCLEALGAGSSWPLQIIVVNQGEEEPVASLVEATRAAGLGITHVRSSQHGRSAGINRGLERVETPFVAITDDDCLVERHWSTRVAEALRETPDRIVTGRVELAGNDEVPFSVVTSRSPRLYVRPELRVHPLIGGNMGVSMENVARIGQFDEEPSISCAEDSDWGYRALRLGIPIAYDPNLLVYHYHWRDAGQRASRYREYSRSIGGFYGKFLLRGGWLIPLQAARDLVRGPIRWLRGLLKGDQDMIDRGRADTLGLLPGIVAGMRRQE